MNRKDAMHPAALQHPCGDGEAKPQLLAANHGVTTAPRRGRAGCRSPTASTRWHHIMVSPLHFLVNEVPPPRCRPAGRHESQRKGRSCTPILLSPQGLPWSSRRSSLAAAGTDLPSSSLPEDACHIPGKSLCWIPGMGMRSQASLRAESI